MFFCAFKTRANARINNKFFNATRMIQKAGIGTEEASVGVLSLQPDSLYQYIGNKAASFPLQCMGYNICTVSTTNLWSKGAYKSELPGKDIEPAELKHIFENLNQNHFLDFDIILSGCMRSAELLSVYGELLTQLTLEKEKVFVVCDPVLGNSSAGYCVPLELSEIYKGHIIPNCNFVTPNAFETKVLTGVDVESNESAREACRRFHEMGAEYCLLKGVSLSDTAGKMSMVLSCKGDRSIYCVTFPNISSHYLGCGDLCTALSSAWLFRYPENLQLVLERTAATMFQVISESLHMKSKHLRIIENRVAYTEPPSFSFPVFPINERLRGIIFDMDGTLTEPGAIDFSSMYSRIGIKKKKGIDILTQIVEDLPADKHEGAHAIIIDEEMKGCDRMQLRSDFEDLIEFIKVHKIRASISTRNCYNAFLSFLKISNLKADDFIPALSRESLGGINKPDPRVAIHILEKWDAVNFPHEIWFVGDSIDDMKCGKGAGCKTCLISASGVLDSNYDPIFVDVTVQSLSEFVELIRYHQFIE